MLHLSLAGVMVLVIDNRLKLKKKEYSATQIMILLLVTYYMEGNFKTRSDFVDGVDIGARADGCFKGNVDLMWVGSFD